MSEPQTISPNTWTRIQGTDLEVHVKMDGASALQIEPVDAEDGRYVVVTGWQNVSGPVSLRTQSREP